MLRKVGFIIQSRKDTIVSVRRQNVDRYEHGDNEGNIFVDGGGVIAHEFQDVRYWRTRQTMPPLLCVLHQQAQARQDLQSSPSL